jgi:hypothetical protein
MMFVQTQLKTNNEYKVRSITFIHKALLTSADVTKCCTEIQTKNPKQQAMQL